MSRQPPPDWEGARSVPVPEALVARVGAAFPEVSILLVHEINERAKTDPRSLVTYNGRDASEQVTRALASALLALEQLRLEVDDQVRGHTVLSTLCSSMLPSILSLEGQLVQSTDLALKLHETFWRASR